jgi:threonine dehydrogenase-like Zn-dependent dehydrogenase
MQQLVYTAPKQLEWQEAPEPVLDSDGAALVRPLAVATCDLDAMIVRGATPFPAPFPIGHECVAEVLEVGDGVSATAPGALVSVPFQISCGQCASCRQGRSSNCSEVPFMATYGFGPAVERWGGFLSDVVAVPYADHMLVPLPDGVAPASAASASDNIADAWRAVAPPLEREPGAPVLVIGGAGSGSIGLYSAAVALALGAEQVVYAEAARAVPDHGRRRIGPRRPRARPALDGARRNLHGLRDLLRRAALGAAAGDVHEGHHVRHRPRQRARGDAACARAGGRRRAAP